MKHTKSDIKFNFANDRLIERINKYQKISIKLLSLYLVQKYAAPNKGTTILYYGKSCISSYTRIVCTP